MLNMQEIQVSASTLCQFRSKTSWHVICSTNNLYLKQTSSIQNTARMVLACSFRHHTSASNHNWDVLNDSGSRLWCLSVNLSLAHWYPGIRCGTWLYRFLIFAPLLTLKAWVKYFGMPCSGPDTFTSPFTKPWSSLVISLIDGYLKVHAKSTWFAGLTRRRDKVTFASVWFFTSHQQSFS